MRNRIQEFFQALNHQDVLALSSLLDENAEFYFPKTRPLIGREQIITFFKILFRGYPGLEFTLHRIIVQGDTAAVHWSNRGHTRRDQPYENEGVTIVEFKQGKIIYLSDFFKDTEKF